MARRGIDYAFSKPTTAAIKAAGASYACRYLSWLPNAKCLTALEAAALISSGIDVVSNWEYYGDWVHDYSGGYASGRIHAIEAQKQHVACGGPPNRPIYFSTDWDVTPAQKPTVGAYYQGVASVIGLARTGAYGGYYTIKYLFDNGLITWGWQTPAWSGGQWDSRAQLRQIQTGVSIGGADCDLDDALTVDFGQWGATTMALEEIVPMTSGRALGVCISDLWNSLVIGKSGYDGTVHQTNAELDRLVIDTTALRVNTAALAAQLVAVKAGADAAAAASSTAIQALSALITTGGGSVDSAAIITAVRAAADEAQETARGLVADLDSKQTEWAAAEADLRQRLAIALGEAA